MKRTIKPFLLFIGFIFLSALYYWQIVHIDKPTAFSFVFGITRAMLILTGFFYFWMLVRHLPFLDSVRQKINQYPSAKNRGRYVIALTLVIVHMVVVYFGAVKFNQYLLSASGKTTNGVIIDCRQNRSGEYCLYQYVVSNKYYQVQIFNRPKKYRQQDAVTILYYSKWPVISAIKE